MAPLRRPQQNFRAIVLQVRNAGEGHRVVDAWLWGHGRTALWARHARSSKKRFGSALAPFVELQIAAVPKDDLWDLHEANSVVDRMGIRSNLEAIGRAATLCRVVQALWPVGQDAEGLFEGLTVALDHLHGGRLARAAGLYPRLAAMGGVLPSTEHCCRCHAPLGGAARKLHESAGLACGSCAGGGPALFSDVLMALRGARIETEAVAHEVEALVAHWVSLFSGTKLVPWAAQPLPKGPSSL